MTTHDSARARTIFVSLTILLVAVLAPRSRALGQAGVTLPSIRTTGPSPAVRRMYAEMGATCKLYKLSPGETPDDTPLRKHLQAWLDTIVDAPFSAKELRKLHRPGASAREENAAIIQQRIQPAPDQTAAYSLSAEISALHASEDTTTTARTTVVAGCQLSGKARAASEVTEATTGSIVETVRTDGETDQTKLARIDTLSMAARLVVIERKLRTRWFAPVRAREQAKAFWRQPGFSTLNVGSISGNGQQGAAFTELASPFLHPIRVSVNSVLASGADEAESDDTPGTSQAAPDGADDSNASESAVTRFLNGGGLVNVGFAWPAIHAALPNEAASVMVLLAPRFGATLPALGASRRDSTLIYDAGSEFHLKATDLIGGAGVFFQLRWSLAGGTGQFADLLGTSKKSFAYSTISTGFVLGERYTVTAGRTLSGPASLRRPGWQVGITAVRLGASTPLPSGPGTSQ